MKPAGLLITTAVTDPDVRRQLSLAAWVMVFLFGWVTFLSAKAVIAENMCSADGLPRISAPTVQK
jgi:hypothetical protein